MGIVLVHGKFIEYKLRNAKIKEDASFYVGLKVCNYRLLFLLYGG